MLLRSFNSGTRHTQHIRKKRDKRGREKGGSLRYGVQHIQHGNENSENFCLALLFDIPRLPDLYS